MRKPPAIEKHISHEEMLQIYNVHYTVVAYAEKRTPYTPTFFDPPVPYTDGYAVPSAELATSLQLIEFETSDIKVAAIYQLTFVNHDPVQILWYLVVGDTAYLLRPNVPN